ncbi:MAG: hypothetical protein AAF639_14160, partial [Chloroflexota bacterium]
RLTRMSLTRISNSFWSHLNIAGRIETYLRKVARDFDAKSYNAPVGLVTYSTDIPDEWLCVGAIPTPKTRLGGLPIT